MLPLVLVLTACNGDPSDQLDQTVDFRTGEDGGAVSGERGTVKITEILWSGSVTEDGAWDPNDVFVEVRNEGNRPINLSGWHLDVVGPVARTYRLPASDLRLGVGEEAFIAAKTTGCFPDPDWVIPDLALPAPGEPVRLVLRDADERLMEPAGSEDHPPFAGGYDLLASYSMERIHLMFGSDGGMPHSWHFYNRRDCPRSVTQGDENRNLSCFEGRPNNDRVAPQCRRYTYASPGRPNSPDYSGAYASGGFE